MEHRSFILWLIPRNNCACVSDRFPKCLGSRKRRPAVITQSWRAQRYFPIPDRSTNRGVAAPGTVRLEQLGRLGLQTAGDLLFHFPRTHEDLTEVRRIADLAAGTMQTVQGQVVEIDGRRLADGRSVVSIVISDDDKHVVEGTWFNQTYAARRFRYGQRVAFSGKPKWYRDHWQMSQSARAGPRRWH